MKTHANDDYLKMNLKYNVEQVNYACFAIEFHLSREILPHVTFFHLLQENGKIAAALNSCFFERMNDLDVPESRKMPNEDLTETAET